MSSASNVKKDHIEFSKIMPEHAALLGDFFVSFAQSDGARYFHPHPLTNEYAGKIACYDGKDLYVAVICNGAIIGYGMLRGWDKGYEIPALGIALLDTARGKGIGKRFMQYLHTAAKEQGATKIRLKVYPDNQAAVMLYKKLGYVFSSEEEGQLVGIVHVD